MSRRQRAKRRGKREAKRARRGLVFLITSDKVIQAMLTSSITSVVFSFNEGVASYVQLGLEPYVPFYIPVKIYGSLGAALLVVICFWADRNTEKWRDGVREATGEEVADDSEEES